MKSYRVVMFVDAPDKKVKVVDDIGQEIEHMIRLYESDVPIVKINLSSVAQIGPDGKEL